MDMLRRHVARAGRQSRTSPRKTIFLSPLAPSAALLALPEFPGHSHSSSLPPIPDLQPSAENVSDGNVPAGEWEPRRMRE